MEPLTGITDFAGLGAAGLMGAMWLWERKLSRDRDQQLVQSHERIMRDEQRLDKLTEVVEHNTTALTRFEEVQRLQTDVLQHMLKERGHVA
jgi:hypothetical protein